MIEGKGGYRSNVRFYRATNATKHPVFKIVAGLWVARERTINRAACEVALSVSIWVSSVANRSLHSCDSSCGAQCDFRVRAARFGEGVQFAIDVPAKSYKIAALERMRLMRRASKRRPGGSGLCNTGRFNCFQHNHIMCSASLVRALCVSVVKSCFADAMRQ
jgi:hypothetical protein